MSKDKLSVLIVEDDENDLALILRELNKGNFELYFENVDNSERFKAALNKKWDVIISDYSMPGFTGFDALNIYNDYEIKTPFLMVSGTVGEDIAVDMMKAGAKDYIMKKSLKRLLPAIRREIEEGKIKENSNLIAREKEILAEINREILDIDNLDDLLNKIYSKIKEVLYSENFFIALYDSERNEISFPLFKDKIDPLPAPRKIGKGLTEYILSSGKSLVLDSANFMKFIEDNKLETKISVHESWIGVPLISHSKPIGVISVSSYEKNIKFSDKEKNFLSNIANQIALAIENKKAEEVLIKSQKRLKEAQRIGKIGNWEWLPSEKKVIWSEEMYKIFGVEPGTVIDEDLSISVFHPDDREFVFEATKKALEELKPHAIECRILKPNGDIGYVYGSGEMIFDDKGKLVKMIGIYQDITERKLAEEKIKTSEQKFKAAFMTGLDAMYVATLEEGLTVEMNDEFVKVFGYSREELIGKTSLEMNLYADAADRARLINLLKKERRIKDYEIKGRRKNGDIITVSISMSLIELDGKPHILGVMRDISERKFSEDNLRKSEEHYRTLLSAIPDMMFRLSSDGRFLDYHAEDISVLFASPEYFLGKHFSEVLPPNVSEKLAVTIETAKKKNGVGVFEYDVTMADDKMCFYECRLSCYGEEIIAIVRDVTDKVNVEYALIESENKYRHIFENVQDVFYRANDKGIIIDISPSIEKYSGYKREEILGISTDIFYQNPQDREKFLNEVINKGQVTDYELSLKTKSGKLIHTSVNAHILYNTSGKQVGIEGSLRDISERKKFEETLKESEERYRILIETMHDGVVQVDNDDIIQFVNNSMCEMLGYKYHELVGKVGVDTFIFKDDREIVREKNRLRLTGLSDNYEVRGVKKTGEIIWLSISGTPIGDKAGKVIGSVGFLSDITERKRAEDEVHKISQAIKQSPVTIVITDVNGDIEYVNPKFVEVTGYKPEEVIGRNPRILKSGERPKEFYKDLWEIITSGKDWIGEFHNKKKNGELYWENASISPVKNSEGVITHFLAVKEDVTEKKLKEIELINAKKKAEESERLKSSFLANMSHELRTPMVGILGFAELMKDMSDNSELQDFSDNILRSGKRLLETLNLILDLSRIEAGKLEMKTSEVDLVQLTGEVFENYVAETTKKNIKFTINSSEEQIICLLDERMLWEAINNLINNAIKYTKSGEVKIELGVTENKKALIKVTDTGIGIPKESLGVIFDEFRQVSEGYSRGFEGTGLGLTITKNFVEKIGGSISVESEVGVGSVFKIELPLLEIVKSKLKKKETEDKKFVVSPNKEISILCVDDDSFTREYLKYILKDVYKLSFAESGIEALEIAKTKKFDAVLMDINLGKGIDGIETTKKIHKLPGYAKVPVIAMTAFAMKGDREEFLNSGMNDYISKPFKSNELLKLVDNVLKKSNQYSNLQVN